MASSKVMASASNPDQSKSFGSMNMDELLKNIYAEADAFPVADNGGGLPLPKNVGNRTVDEVWKEIVTGGGSREEAPEMTLEDFLTKAGAVTEDDVRITAMTPPLPGFVDDPVMDMQPYGVDSVGFGNGMDGRVVAVAAGGGGGRGGVGRGKRRTLEEPPMDKATQQKQRRMIKNRESAARSRERKQAYTVELESLVTQLEEENARLLREEAEQSKERFKQLMENLIPVVEERRPPRSLRRVHSMHW